MKQRFVPIKCYLFLRRDVHGQESSGFLLPTENIRLSMNTEKRKSRHTSNTAEPTCGIKCASAYTSTQHEEPTLIPSPARQYLSQLQPNPI